jgi:sirohydrochlorin cobaltochelatase
MRHRKIVCAAFAAAGILAGAATAFAADEPDHSTMDMGPDAQGRSLYGMKHEMDPALMAELRSKVALFRDDSDAQMALNMDMMGAEYAWYISPPGLKGSQGVLILTHGFLEQGDKIFKDQVQPIGNIFPTAMGVGMAMMMSRHIQVALDDLTAKGVKEIAVVPVTSTDTNELYRQWMYILGREKQAEFATVPRAKTAATLRFVPPPGDDPLVAETLLDYALEMSTDPKNEVVIIAGHGPGNSEDNEKELRTLANLARLIKEDGQFAAVYGQTLQDDTPPEIREANVKKLRALVENATKDGKRVLIVTNLIAARGIQAKLRNDLKGLDFKFNAKGIVQHANFMKWMSMGISNAFEGK